MQFSRRGFLQTIATALGAAALDPISKLWVPNTAPVQLVSAAEYQAAGDYLNALAGPPSTWLDEFAREVAQAMAYRMDTSKVLAVGAVDFRHKPDDPLGLLEIPDIGRNIFMPADRQLRVIEDRAVGHRIFAVNELANELRYRAMSLEVLVPITRELRPGDAFSDDVEVGVGTDQETGVSVRVIRFEQEGRGGAKRLLGAEVAGGRWMRL